MKNVQLLVKKALDLISEVETYSFYKTNLEESLTRLFDAYQSGRFDYFQYEAQQRKLLRGRSKEEWMDYYDSYIRSILKRIEQYNGQIFYEAYQDEDFLYIGQAKPERHLVRVEEHVPAPVPPKDIAVKKEERHGIVVQRRVAVSAQPTRQPTAVHKEKVIQEEMIRDLESAPKAPVMPEAVVEEIKDIGPEPALVKVKPSVLDSISLFFKKLFAGREVKAQREEVKRGLHAPAPKVVKKKEEPKVKAKVETKPTARPEGWFMRLFTPKQEGFSFPGPEEVPQEKTVHEAEKKAKEAEKKTDVHLTGGIFDSIKAILDRSKQVEFSEHQEKIELSTLHLETSRRKIAPEIKTQIEKITATALTKEAKRIKSIMGRKKALKIYQPSFFGALANLTIKRISLFLLDAFPDFFKELYHSLRLANIKILSNTYVNMMVLGVISSFFAGIFFMGLFFAATPLPITQIISRTLMMALLLSLVTFAGFYAYPSSVVKQRRRSINSNLPFAINHMSAVASSGVSPTKMFKLISQSREYGDISIEIEKIVNYIEIFGYDILTSIKAIAATTPSYAFKDFLEGMISTTQTGGDIKTYLAQKAEEAMLNYKLERQKYSETIATYSDIYTGILIAAPLFFVAALSLVSLLGGTVGGMDVNVIIVMGTYVIIPVMNVSFLTFLEMTQPEI